MSIFWSEKSYLSTCFNFYILKKNKNDSLDHKYSIFYGFYNDVPPKIIGSIYNLEYLPKSKNCSKQTKCSIDLKTLNEMYENEN